MRLEPAATEAGRTARRDLRTRLEISGITIAIDELDKFADPVQAHEFVNEVKTVFGVNSCVFLVSVSDDALASFERRGIPVRDALDSAFAAMIAVAPFSCASAMTGWTAGSRVCPARLLVCATASRRACPESWSGQRRR